MNVLVIAEDFVNDQYVLKPILSAMLKWIGRPNAKVRVCHDPRLAGVDQALKWERIEEILARYPMIDLFILCVDRDGLELGRQACADWKSAPQRSWRRIRILLAENAWQEVEVWVLAGHPLPRKWRWKAIRQEINPKETYFAPFARQRGVSAGVGEGRKALSEEAAGKYERIRRLCPEDVAHLEQRIAAWLTRSP